MDRHPAVHLLRAEPWRLALLPHGLAVERRKHERVLPRKQVADAVAQAAVERGAGHVLWLGGGRRRRREAERGVVPRREGGEGREAREAREEGGNGRWREERSAVADGAGEDWDWVCHRVWKCWEVVGACEAYSSAPAAWCRHAELVVLWIALKIPRLLVESVYVTVCQQCANRRKRGMTTLSRNGGHGA